MSLPGYKEYKDGPTEWCARVPAHWNAIRVRFLLRRGNEGMKIGPFGSALTADMLVELGSYKVYGQENIISRDFGRGDRWIDKAKFEELSAYEIQPGDILITMMGTSGRCDVVPVGIQAGVMDSHLLRLRLEDTEQAEFVRLLIDESDYVGVQIRLAGKGSIMHGLNSGVVRDLTLVMPPRGEQEAILRFLNLETAKIDALISEQKRLIEILQEKRQAVISHAVTKGLSPDVPMKSSGVEWLGNVPAHWTYGRLKRFIRSMDYGISDALEPEGAVAVLRMGNIQDGKVKFDDLKFAGSVGDDMLLMPGDLLYNRTNSLDLIGKVGLLEIQPSQPVSFASYLVRLRLVSQASPHYFAYLLNTEGILGVARASAFVSIGQCNLNPTRYAHIEVFVPPYEEQVTIVEYLQAVLSEIDELVGRARDAIQLLRERRSALISAAVTGQIDVRGLVEQEAA